MQKKVLVIIVDALCSRTALPAMEAGRLPMLASRGVIANRFSVGDAECNRMNDRQGFGLR